MTKTNPAINYAAAIHKLRTALLISDGARDDKESEPDQALRYATAYGTLKAYVKDVLKDADEGEDIPDELFTKPGATN